MIERPCAAVWQYEGINQMLNAAHTKLLYT